MTETTVTDWTNFLNAATNLDDLLNRVRQLDRAASDGDQIALHVMNSNFMADLPTFGGPEPDDTTEIWSWDAERWLAGSGSDIKIEDRDDITA